MNDQPVNTDDADAENGAFRGGQHSGGADATIAGVQVALEDGTEHTAERGNEEQGAGTVAAGDCTPTCTEEPQDSIGLRATKRRRTDGSASQAVLPRNFTQHLIRTAKLHEAEVARKRRAAGMDLPPGPTARDRLEALKRRLTTKWEHREIPARTSTEGNDGQCQRTDWEHRETNVRGGEASSSGGNHSASGGDHGADERRETVLGVPTSRAMLLRQLVAGHTLGAQRGCEEDQGRDDVTPRVGGGASATVRAEESGARAKGILCNAVGASVMAPRGPQEAWITVAAAPRHRVGAAATVKVECAAAQLQIEGDACEASADRAVAADGPSRGAVAPRGGSEEDSVLNGPDMFPPVKRPRRLGAGPSRHEEDPGDGDWPATNGERRMGGTDGPPATASAAPGGDGVAGPGWWEEPSEGSEHRVLGARNGCDDSWRTSRDARGAHADDGRATWHRGRRDGDAPSRGALRRGGETSAGDGVLRDGTFARAPEKGAAGCMRIGQRQTGGAQDVRGERLRNEGADDYAGRHVGAGAAGVGQTVSLECRHGHGPQGDGQTPAGRRDADTLSEQGNTVADSGPCGVGQSEGEALRREHDVQGLLRGSHRQDAPREVCAPRGGHPRPARVPPPRAVRELRPWGGGGGGPVGREEPGSGGGGLASEAVSSVYSSECGGEHEGGATAVLVAGLSKRRRDSKESVRSDTNRAVQSGTDAPGASVARGGRDDGTRDLKNGRTGEERPETDVEEELNMGGTDLPPRDSLARRPPAAAELTDETDARALRRRADAAGAWTSAGRSSAVVATGGPRRRLRTKTAAVGWTHSASQLPQELARDDGMQALLRGQLKTEKSTVVRSLRGDKLLDQESRGAAGSDRQPAGEASAAASVASTLAAHRPDAAAQR